MSLDFTIGFCFVPGPAESPNWNAFNLSGSHSGPQAQGCLSQNGNIHSAQVPHFQAGLSLNAARRAGSQAGQSPRGGVAVRVRCRDHPWPHECQPRSRGHPWPREYQPRNRDHPRPWEHQPRNWDHPWLQEHQSKSRDHPWPREHQSKSWDHPWPREPEPRSRDHPWPRACEPRSRSPLGLWELCHIKAGPCRGPRVQSSGRCSSSFCFPFSGKARECWGVCEDLGKIWDRSSWS